MFFDPMKALFITDMLKIYKNFVFLPFVAGENVLKAQNFWQSNENVPLLFHLYPEKFQKKGSI